MIAGMKLTNSALRKTITKHGYTQDEVIFAIGSEDLVKRMRKAGWLLPIFEKPLLFDSGSVARCWARIIAGEQP